MAGISGTGLGLAGWRRKKQRRDKKQLEKTKVEYKMNLLKQQALVANLNPHFIFNALNAIQAFINTSDIRNANEYLALFSKLMRQQLNTAGRDLIPVSEELERLKNYLSIEKLRFGDKLEYTVETDERIRMHDVSIPNMIIQPFLENAIWHGFKGMKAQGHISLSLHFNESDELIIRVADNGKGIDGTLLSKSASKDPRGISLIRERLELLSETGSDVITFSELYPGNAMPGTVVTIRLSPRMFRYTA
jgi:LytS/YehU family sensor histidine kinase